MSDLEVGTPEFNIKKAIASLLFRHPFYGYLVQTMKWRKDETIRTLATNGKEIIYNSAFINSLDVKECVFAIAHEIGHCIFSHIRFRVKDRDRLIWNMAADYKVNSLLIRDSVGQIRKDWLYDSRFDKMEITTEEIYDTLIKEGAKPDQTLDEHLEGGESTSEPSSSNTNNEAREAQEFRNKIIQAYQFAKMAGSSSASIETLVRDFLEPKINWKKLLQHNIQSLFKSDISWRRPSRRTADPRFILPTSEIDQSVDICISIDTSGSISEEQKKEFLSEIYGILKFYKTFQLTIWCFDTSVHNVAKYSQSTISTLREYVLAGGGGTDIACNFEFMKQNKIKPRHFVCLTDGYNFSSNWGDSNYCPTTWIIHSNSNPEVPFGKWVNYQ